MARGEWRPPRWLVWYGYAWAMAWGLPVKLPIEDRNPLADYVGVDLDEALLRLLAEEGR